MMTTQNTKTRIEKTFTLSSYEGGGHRTSGWIDNGNIPHPELSFAESLSPLHIMVETFRLRPLGTKIKVTMEEIT